MCELNFGILSNYEKAVIVTENKTQLSAIEKKMREEHPQLMNLWREGELSDYEIDMDYHDWDGDICVAPHIYDDIIDTLQVADEGYWRKRGYALVPFDMLIYEPDDFGEIDTDGMDITKLLG